MLDNIGSQAQYNQASFQQIRLHELTQLLDKWFLNLFYFDVEYNDWCYNLFFNALICVISPVCTKMTESEHQELEKMEEEIYNILKKPIQTKESIISLGGKQGYISIDSELKDLIRIKLKSYRRKVEKLQDIHGYGNPTKADPRRAIIGN
jgi:hypothetical protein